jgi:hypothetical protein
MALTPPDPCVTRIGPRGSTIREHVAGLSEGFREVMGRTLAPGIIARR